MSVRVALACAIDRDRALRNLMQGEPELRVAPWLVAATSIAIDPLPDVLVVDLASLGPDGIKLIDRVMQSEMPVPILALIGNPPEGPDSDEVLRHGAVASMPSQHGTTDGGLSLRRKVAMVAGVHVIRHAAGRAHVQAVNRVRVVALGASTGGPPILAQILQQLPPLPVPILIVQHLQPEFQKNLTNWLASVANSPVLPATNAIAAEPGNIYIAVPGRHLVLRPDLRLGLLSEPESIHRPSVDMLFASIAEVAGPAGLGILLTGMGEDGAQGLLAMRRAGATTFAQDEASCAIFGMPKAAIEIGAAQRALAPEHIAAQIASILASEVQT